MITNKYEGLLLALQIIVGCMIVSMIVDVPKIVSLFMFAVLVVLLVIVGVGLVDLIRMGVHG